MKLKLVLPVFLATALSTAAFAANDSQTLRFKDDPAQNTVIASVSHSSAGLNRSALNRNDEHVRTPPQDTDNPRLPSPEMQPPQSNDTCMGSKSTGMQLPVVGGISFGSSWTDKNCMMIKNARELWNMGYKKAALARMCMDDGNREALESTGTACPSRRTESSAPMAEPTALTYLR